MKKSTSNKGACPDSIRYIVKRMQIEWYRDGVITYHNIWDFFRLGVVNDQQIARAILAGDETTVLI